jgi:hypothetical protein
MNRMTTPITITVIEKSFPEVSRGLTSRKPTVEKVMTVMYRESMNPHPSTSMYPTVP